MGLGQEFKEFVMRGNVLDLAVGVIIGGAFGLIVSSLVNDMIMPPIGLAMGHLDFSHLRIILQPAADLTKTDPTTGLPAGEVSLRYGRFINTIINFLIVAAAVFALIKAINSVYRKRPAPPTTKDCPFCATAIPSLAKRCPHCTSELPLPGTT